MKRSSIARVLLFCACSFAGGAIFAQLASARTESQSPYDPLTQLARVLVLIENEYVEPVDRATLVDGSIRGLVAELDPHSTYMPPRDYQVFQGDTEGRFGGIGVEVDFRSDRVTVIAPIEGSPAERGGVRPGDRIVGIDNESVRGKNIDQLVQLMRGEPGTSVVITIRRKNVNELLQFTLKREVIEVSSIASKRLKDGIAYIRVKAFQSGTHAELLEAIGDLREATNDPIAGVVLDLRNNPGGLVDEATRVADEFLKGGVIYTTRRRGRVVDTARAHKAGALRRGPMVVLVNEFSASAAELVAGALQDNRRATVVGTPTFGKGSVQTILDLPGGAGLKLTTMRYYTPSGRAIQAQGVRPDVLVEAAYAAKKEFGIVREEDLENHLPAEGPPGSNVKPLGKEDEPKEETPAEVDTHLGVSRDVPVDPTGSKDFALSIGFQIVKKGLRP